MRPGWKTTALCLGALCAASAAAPLRAQVPPVPQALRDSVANPPKAQGSGAMRFLETHIDTGRIGEDDLPPSYTFRWTNDGDAPLVITRTEQSCTCLSVKYPRKPLMPGESSTFEITYNPKNETGPFNNNVKIYSNTGNSRPVAVFVRGEVVK